MAATRRGAGRSVVASGPTPVGHELSVRSGSIALLCAGLPVTVVLRPMASVRTSGNDDPAAEPYRRRPGGGWVACRPCEGGWSASGATRLSVRRRRACLFVGSGAALCALLV